MRVIAYGIPADYIDEYLCIGEDTTIKSVRLFANTVIHVFGLTYLHSPNEEDTIRLMAMNEKTSWPGMFESLDYMPCTWKNCAQRHGMACIAVKGRSMP
jgi:hypothetical protein